MMFLLQIEPFTGAAGWAGVFISAPVLGWLLLKHLPAKDKQIETFIETKDKQLAAFIAIKDEQLKEKDAQLIALINRFEGKLDEITNKFLEAEKRLREDFNNNLNSIMNSHSQQLNLIVQEWRKP